MIGKLLSHPQMGNDRSTRAHIRHPGFQQHGCRYSQDSGAETTPQALQQLAQGDDQAALGNQCPDQPFHLLGHRLLYSGPGLLPQRIHACFDFCDTFLDSRDIGLGREVGVEQGDMLVSEGSACCSVKPQSVRRLTKR